MMASATGLSSGGSSHNIGGISHSNSGSMNTSDNGEYDHLYKVILVGDATVGKTHLLSRYIRGTLPKSPKATIGVEFATRTVPLAVGGTVKAQIWDTAGQERYRSITSAHYRRAVGAILVYDITRKQTFLNASKWLEDLRQSAEPDIVIMMVGNKVDIVEKEPSAREVPYELAATFAQSNNIFFSESSAVTSFNVKHIFEHLLQEIYNQRTKGGCLTDGGGVGGVMMMNGGGGGVAGGMALGAGKWRNNNSGTGYGGRDNADGFGGGMGQQAACCSI